MVSRSLLQSKSHDVWHHLPTISASSQFGFNLPLSATQAWLWRSRILKQQSGRVPQEVSPRWRGWGWLPPQGKGRPRVPHAHPWWTTGQEGRGSWRGTPSGKRAGAATSQVESSDSHQGPCSGQGQANEYQRDQGGCQGKTSHIRLESAVYIILFKWRVNWVKGLAIHLPSHGIFRSHSAQT